MKYLTLVFAAILISCGSSQQEELQILKEEVLAIHDEVMPKMGTLNKAKKDLQSRAESIIEKDIAQSETFQALANKLDEANENMREWMREFDAEFEGTDEEIKKYLEAQKAAIQKVKESMDKSLESGKKMLEN